MSINEGSPFTYSEPAPAERPELDRAEMILIYRSDLEDVLGFVMDVLAPNVDLAPMMNERQLSAWNALCGRVDS